MSFGLITKTVNRSLFKSLPAQPALLFFLGIALFLGVTTAKSLAGYTISVDSDQTVRALTINERIAYQQAIEEVYWRQRIWPKENQQSKPTLDEVMPHSVIEQKVKDYLRKSQALDDYWQRPITGEQLQAEMNRMAKQTKQPDLLRQLWAALDNDPFLIAECLARPSLVERSIRTWYAYDQRFHNQLRKAAETQLKTKHNLEQMNTMGGEYSQIKWSKIGGNATSREAAEQGVFFLSSKDWEARLLALTEGLDERTDTPPSEYREPSKSTSPIQHEVNLDSKIEQLSVGKLSKILEKGECFYAFSVVSKNKIEITTRTVEWKKVSFDEWWRDQNIEVSSGMAELNHRYHLSVIVSVSSAIDDTWIGINDSFSARSGHTAIWTGAEMIVWGGGAGISLNSGGRYTPALDDWTLVSTSEAPIGRSGHTAIWTGAEMIVWGGNSGMGPGFLNNGGRYNAQSNTWTSVEALGSPSPRMAHKSVWTGSEMIIWGGNSDGQTHLKTGGRFNPSTNQWVDLSTADAPTDLQGRTAVWTGSEMIVWGGRSSPANDSTNAGSIYNPTSDTWSPTDAATAPARRSFHSAIWTGTEMIVWGGRNRNMQAFNTGGRYNPVANIWLPLNTIGAPSPRENHQSVWTGHEMIIWGGNSNVGGRYNPATDTWKATNPTNAPDPGIFTAIWTGSEMIVWGNLPGGRYFASPFPDLDITMAAQPDPVTAGSNVTFSISLTNRGSDTATNITVTDDLPQGLFFVSCDVPPSAICGGSGNNRTISINSLEPGGVINITLVATVECSVANGALISDVATVTSESPDSNLTNNLATDNFIVSNPPLNVSPTSQSFTSSGGSGTLSVTEGNSCSWMAISDVAWINITSGGSGIGNGTISYSVDAHSNTGNRSGTITIANQTFTVLQGAAFLDVPTNHPFYTEIGKLSARGVTLGCGGGNYCPDQAVTREQMAAFIMRAKGEFNPPTPASQRFNDVPPTNPFYNFIDRMAVLNITLGCSDTPPMYCPTNAVSREQMAAFMIRGLGVFNPPPPAVQRFDDVQPNNLFYGFIEEMAVRGITLGCSANPPLYCPSQSVTRGQMAAFLVRAFNL